MNKDNVLALAKLARIEISETEAENLSHEFDAILGYVGEVKKIASERTTEPDMTLRNVFREDTTPHESGIYTEQVLTQAPQREESYVKVKKIL